MKTYKLVAIIRASKVNPETKTLFGLLYKTTSNSGNIDITVPNIYGKGITTIRNRLVIVLAIIIGYRDLRLTDLNHNVKTKGKIA
jgi:hypothetical protein